MTIDFDEVTWVDESDPDFDPDTDPKLDAANLQRYDDAIDSLIAAVAAAEGDITSLSTGLDTAEDDITDAQSDITTLQSDVAALQNHDIVIATSIAGLGTAYDGKRGRLRLGSSPYQFIDLVYDSTYAKWVSDAFPWVSVFAPTSRLLGYSITSGSTTTMLTAFLRKMEAVAAGLTLQARFIGTGVCSVSIASAIVDLIPFDQALSSTSGPSANSGAKQSTTLATSTTNELPIDTGWLPLAFANSAAELGGTFLVLRNTGGSTSTISIGGNLSYRWVG